MAVLRKCPKCGVDLADAAASLCPFCGTSLATPRQPGIWWGAVLQFVAATAFLLVFKFPKWMIVAFGVMVLVAAVATLKVRQAGGVTLVATRRPVARPVLFRIISLAIGVCAISLFATALLGLVIFMDAWNRWQRYEGQPFHRAEFEVAQAYFQKRSRGAVSIYARGTVEGQTEWMSLQPYVRTRIRSQEELDERVGRGTSIPIYLFPGLQGRARVQMFSEPPPAEASKTQAVSTARNALTGLAFGAVFMLVLIRVRRLCYAPAAEVTTE